MAEVEHIKWRCEDCEAGHVKNAPPCNECGGDDTDPLEAHIYGGHPDEFPAGNRYALYALMLVASVVTGYVVSLAWGQFVAVVAVIAVVVGTARIGFAALGGGR